MNRQTIARAVARTSCWKGIASSALLYGVCAVVLLAAGCEFVPSKPDAVFVLYRDKMKSGDLKSARSMLSDDSRELTVAIAATYKLQEPPENLALLNILDPASPPTVMKEADTDALLQVRTLKGGLRLIHLVRSKEKGHWKVEMSEDLNALRTFLEARSALELLREQAGEAAATWKLFSDQLERMKALDSAAEPREKADLQRSTTTEKKKNKRP